MFSELPDMITGVWVPGSLSGIWWLLATFMHGGVAVVAHDFLIRDLTVAVGKVGLGAF